MSHAPEKEAAQTAGEILNEEFLKPLRMTQTALAEKMNVPLQRINDLINGRRGVTAETAILLSRVFANSAEFWMNLQSASDLWVARQKLAKRG